MSNGSYVMVKCPSCGKEEKISATFEIFGNNLINMTTLTCSCGESFKYEDNVVEKKNHQ